MIRWPGVIKPGTIINDIGAHEDMLPTLLAAAGDPNVKEELLKGMKVGDKTFKVHLDGYNITDTLAGKAPARATSSSTSTTTARSWRCATISGRSSSQEQRAHGFDVWQEPFVTAPRAEALQPRIRSVREVPTTRHRLPALADRHSLLFPAQPTSDNTSARSASSRRANRPAASRSDKIAEEGMFVHRLLRRGKLHSGSRELHHRRTADPHRHDHGRPAGASIGSPAEACTIATALEEQGYATGQFGKNHLGDKNEFLPTVHGFDEFFGYLYHLDAMEDPAHPNYPQDLLNVVGPRNMVHSWATDVDDPTGDAALGQDRQTRRSRHRTLSGKRMKTVDNESATSALTFIEKAKVDDEPFFCWLNPDTHAHRHPSFDEYERCAIADGSSKEEADIAQLDDDVRLVMQKLKDLGFNDHLVVFTTDNGTELFTWPDGGTTPFAQSKGTVMEGGFRVPCILRWPGHVPADSVQNGIFSGLDWFPTFLAAAGNPNITDQLLKGVKLGDSDLQNHRWV